MTAAGEAASVKSAAGATVSATVVVRVRPPPVPVIVTVAGPSAASSAAAKVRLVVGPGVVGGANVADTPAGSPLAVKVTGAEKPFSCAIVTVVTAVAPWTTVTAAELTVCAKSGAGVTVSAIAVVRVSPPPVPVR